MKYSLVTAAIIGQVSLALLSSPMLAGTVDLVVGPRATVSASGCGNPAPVAKSVQYDVRSVSNILVDTALSESFGFTPASGGILYASEAPGDCRSHAYSVGQKGVVAIKGEVSDSSNNASGVFANSSLNTAEISILPNQGRTFFDLQEEYGNLISVTPNVSVSGFVYTNSNGSEATLTATARVTGFAPNGQQQFITDTATITTFNAPGSQNIGLTSFGRPFGQLGTAMDSQSLFGASFTNGLMIDPTREIFIDFELDGFATAGRFNGNQTGTAGFSSLNSLSFDPDGPAFFVPDGFTVYSEDLGIIDNRWIDPRIAVTGPSAVPIPAGGWLLLSALGLLATRIKKIRN